MLEYIGYYNQFQQGALIRLNTRDITHEHADEYIKLYCEWRLLKDNKQTAKEAEDKRNEMKKIEDEYAADKILILRKFA